MNTVESRGARRYCLVWLVPIAPPGLQMPEFYSFSWLFSVRIHLP